MTRPRSFGEPEPARDMPEQGPVPVLHVGEVTAELRLHITDDTLHDLGSQIASMIANAVRQGMQAGVAEAMAEINDP